MTGMRWLDGTGVAGQRAMFASKPSRTEAAPRAVSFRQRTPFSRAAPRSLRNPMDRGAWQATVHGGHTESNMT